MSKITLSNVNNLTSWTSAGNTIDANSLAIENAVENTLSRDGTSPNEMNAQLDMNSNQIINLPYPATASSPIRLQDAPTFAGPPGPAGPPGLPGTPGIDGNAFDYNTRTIAISSNVPSSASWIRTLGYNTVGDGGGATYAKVNAINPSYAPYSISTNSGTKFWQYVPESMGWNAKVAGVVADGVTDDSDNVMKALLPFQNGTYISGGGGVTGTLILPNGNMIITKPIIVTGSSGAALKMVGQSQSASGRFSANTTSFVWKGTSTYPSMLIAYGSNQTLFEAINFDGSTGYLQGALRNSVHVTADNSYAVLLNSPVAAGSDRVFNVSTTVGLRPGTALGVGAAGYTPFPVGTFEIVYVKYITSATTFVADCVHAHATNELIGFSPPTNNIRFHRCWFGNTVSPFSTCLFVGNQITNNTPQAAAVEMDDCYIVGGIVFTQGVTVTAASPAVVTDTAHGLTLGRAVKLLGASGGAISNVVGLSTNATYYVVPINENSYHLTTDFSVPGVHSDTGANIFDNTINPGTITIKWAGHVLTPGTPLVFQTDGSIPSNLSGSNIQGAPSAGGGFVPGGPTYYVSSTNCNAGVSFQIVTTPGSGGIAYSGTVYGNTRIISSWFGVPLVNTTGSLGTVQRYIRCRNGFYTEGGGNIKNWLFTGGNYNECEIAINGDPMSGSCEIYYPTLAQISIADIQANGAGNLNVTSAESESVGQKFLMGIGGANNISATLIQNSYQSGLPYDGYVISWPGSLTLINNLFNNASGDGPNVGAVPKVKISNLGNPSTGGTNPSSIISKGNYWQFGDGSTPIFYNGSNTPFDAAAEVTGTWVVEQTADYGDGNTGKYPSVFGALSIGKFINTPTTFASLPANPVDGQRSFITNCNTTTFGTAANGSGTNHVPVYYSAGTASWLVG